MSQLNSSNASLPVIKMLSLLICRIFLMSRVIWFRSVVTEASHVSLECMKESTIDEIDRQTRLCTVTTRHLGRECTRWISSQLLHMAQQTRSGSPIILAVMLSPKLLLVARRTQIQVHGQWDFSYNCQLRKKYPVWALSSCATNASLKIVMRIPVTGLILSSSSGWSVDLDVAWHTLGPWTYCQQWCYIRCKGGLSRENQGESIIRRKILVVFTYCIPSSVWAL